MRYTNPVIPGSHPDPSVCRVGKDYYLVTSSFQYFPGVPLYHSKDLVHWRQIGHCLTRRSQLDLTGSGARGGIYAPTIRYHDKTFYMTTTNMPSRGNFFVTAEDPRGDWSEPVYVEQDGIDPSIFFDDDGRAYFASTGKDCIVQSEIDIKTGKRLTDVKEIWAGTGGSYPEGPHLYKIGKWYYLMIAEGGTEYGHMETIARSESPWGPFTGCPENPILSHRSSCRPIQATGHADLVEAGNGGWWAVFLGIRPNGHPFCHHLGRETFLAPVKWRPDGWPELGDGGAVSFEMEAEGIFTSPAQQEETHDDFNNPSLGFCWNFIRNPREDSWSLSERPGWLRLEISPVSLDDWGSPCFVGRRQEHFDCVATTLLDFSPASENEEAGLCAYTNEHHHYEIAVTMRKRARFVIVRRRVGDLTVETAGEKIGAGAVRLSIEAERDLYHFRYAVGNGDFREIAKAQTRYLSTEIAGGWTGVYLAMYATGNGKMGKKPAFFDRFDYSIKQVKAPRRSQARRSQVE